MAKIKSVKFNFVMNVMLTGSTFIFPLITFPYISRILLPEGVGKVNFAMSMVIYFNMFAMLGIPTYGVRACAKVRDDKMELTRMVHEILFINLIMGIGVYILYFLALWNIPRLQSDKMLFYVMGSYVFFNVLGVEWLYKGLEQYSYITVRSICFKFIAMCLMFLLVKDRDDYVLYGGISIFAAVGSNLLNFMNLRKYIDLYPVGGYHVKRHLKAITVFFLMSVAATIYTNLDTVMLGFMQSDEEVGYYSAAVKVKNVLVSFVTALSTVLLPRVSYYIEHNMWDKFMVASQKALNFVVLAALPAAVYFSLCAEESILLLSGDSFMGAVMPMMIIMPTILCIGITNILGIQIMVPLGQEKLVFYSVFIGAIVDLIVNAVCISSMAASGAALGTLIAELVVLVIQAVMLKNHIGNLIRSIQFGKICISTMCGALGGLWIKSMRFSPFPALVVSAIVFFLIYGIMLFAMKEKFLLDIIKQLQDTRMKKVRDKGDVG